MLPCVSSSPGPLETVETTACRLIPTRGHTRRKGHPRLSCGSLGCVACPILLMCGAVCLGLFYLAVSRSCLSKEDARREKEEEKLQSPVVRLLDRGEVTV